MRAQLQETLHVVTARLTHSIVVGYGGYAVHLAVRPRRLARVRVKARFRIKVRVSNALALVAHSVRIEFGLASGSQDPQTQVIK